MEPDDLLCSRNARLKKALVGGAQWKINQPPSLKKERASLEGAFISFDACIRGASSYLVKRKVSEDGWFDDPGGVIDDSIEMSLVNMLPMSSVNLASPTHMQSTEGGWSCPR